MLEVSADGRRAARETLVTAVVPLGSLRLSGEDRRSFLHGLVTADIKALAAGGWTPSFFLTPKGRLVADLAVHDRGSDILLLTRPALAPLLAQGLSRTIVLTRSSLEPATDHAVAVIGPRASEALRLAGIAAEPAGNARGIFSGAEVWACRARFWGACWLLLCPAGESARLEAAVAAASGGLRVGPEALEALRVEAGIAAVGPDTDEETFPLELGSEEGISFEKGCYLGQETTAKMKHLGRPNRRLARVEPSGPIEEGAVLALDGEPVGRATSPALVAGRPIALSLLKRSAAAAGTRLAAPGGRAAVVL